MSKTFERAIDFVLTDSRVQTAGAMILVYEGVSAHNFSTRIHQQKLECTQKYSGMQQAPSAEEQQSIAQYQKWADARESCSSQIDPGNILEFGTEVAAVGSGAVSLMLLLALGYNQLWRRFRGI